MSSKLEENQYLTFLLNEDVYGLRILVVKEIIEYAEITRVPMMPKFIPGVINLRGNVVPVVDLNSLFLDLKTNVTRKTCIIIVETDSADTKTDVGLLVDLVNEVIEIETIDPPPSFGSRLHTDYIEGIGKVEDKFIVILNMNSVLNIRGIEKIKHSELISSGLE